LAVSSLKPNQSIPLISNVFYITLVQNTGAAFGILKERTIFLIIVAFFAILFIFLYEKIVKETYQYARISMMFILAGTIGNLIDRLRLGYVIDYIDFRVWPVFNLADMLITTGGVLITCEIIIKPLLIKEKANKG
jgi:signal peptidase II